MEFWALFLLYRLLGFSDFSSITYSPLYFALSAVALFYAFRRFSPIIYGREVLVDSEPWGLVGVGVVQFNVIPLVLAIIASFNAGRQLLAVSAVDMQSAVELSQLLVDISLAIVFISLTFPRFQIRENGIVTADGRLLLWNVIQSYAWVKYEDKVRLEVKQWPRGHYPVVLNIPPELRSTVDKYLVQQVGEAE